MQITHRFVSAKADSSDATLVNPSNWNDIHIVIGAVPLLSTDYDFPHIATAENLSPSLRTVTLPSVPFGINGTDTAHYLGIYNNSGVWQENILINGGSAVSGGTNGTLTFVSIAGTYAAGTYKIGTVTAGIQEASVAAGIGALITFPAGILSIHSTITLLSGQGVRGAGSGQTTLWKLFLSGDLIYEASPGASYTPAGSTFAGFSCFVTLATPALSGAFIHVVQGDVAIDDLYFENGFVDIQLDWSSKATISNIRSGGSVANGTGILLGSTGPTGATITNLTMSQGGANYTAIATFWGTFNLTSFQLQGVGSGSTGLYIAPTVGRTAGELQVSNGTLDSFDRALFLTGVGAVFSTSFSDLLLSAPTHDTGGLGGITINSNVTGTTISGVRFSGYTNAIYVIGGSDITILGVTIGNSQSSAAGVTLGVGSGTTGVILTGSRIGISQSGAVDSLMAIAVSIGAGSDEITIVGNNLYGTTAAIADAATLTKAVIESNRGVTDIIPTVASGATITAPISPFASTFKISGTTSVTAINGFWAGRTIRILYPAGAGITIMGRALVAGSSLTLTSDGTNNTGWY